MELGKRAPKRNRDSTIWFSIILCCRGRKGGGREEKERGKEGEKKSAMLPFLVPATGKEGGKKGIVCNSQLSRRRRRGEGGEGWGSREVLFILFVLADCQSQRWRLSFLRRRGEEENLLERDERFLRHLRGPERERKGEEGERKKEEESRKLREGRKKKRRSGHPQKERTKEKNPLLAPGRRRTRRERDKKKKKKKRDVRLLTPAMSVAPAMS